MEQDERQDIIKVLKTYQKRYWILREQIATLGITRDPKFDIEIDNIKKEMKELNALLIEVPTDLDAQQDIRQKILNLSELLLTEIDKQKENEKAIQDLFDKTITLFGDAIMRILKLIDDEGQIIAENVNADLGVELMAYGNDKDIRSEVLLALAIAFTAQLAFDDILITIATSLVIWALLYIRYLIFFYNPFLKRHAKHKERDLQRRKEREQNGTPFDHL